MTINERFLPISKWTRPGKPRVGTMGIVIHWLQNPMQTAGGCWKYFETRTGSYGSAQYIVGLDGIITQCMPPSEIAYHCGSDKPDPESGKIYTDLCRKAFDVYGKYPDKLSPNQITLGIECCHTNEAGEMTTKTYDALVELTATLCLQYHLEPMRHVFTHKEIVGWKDCHKWFVDNPDCWELFKIKVGDKISEIEAKRRGLV